MKVIDLLNKIAKEKKYPKIKFNDSIYEYHDKEHGYCRYYHDNTYICLNTEYYLFDILNDEIEILEEPKGIPEKLRTWYSVEENQSIEENCNYANDNFETMYEKINEIIDYLESKGKSNE